MLPYYMIETANQNRFSNRKWYEVQYQRSQDLFAASKNRGLIERLAAVIRGRKSLLDLNDRLADHDVVAQHSIGRQTVRLDRIVGTQGRTNDFDQDFNPLSSRSAQRWTRIAMAHLAGDNLPPIDLVKIGSEYYVSDGHHRVSVARALEATYIDANVVELVLQPRTMPAPVLNPRRAPDALPC